MGHLPIVSQETIELVISEGCISIRGELKEMIVKTTSDIFSDVLATREGDPVFPWIISSPTGANLGFQYEFTVAGPPFYVPGDAYPVKVPLASEGWRYANHLAESDALDLWNGRLLWNAIGKKSLGRGRALTHQTPEEDNQLRVLLSARNLGGPTRIALGQFNHPGRETIHINPSQENTGWNPTLELAGWPTTERLAHLKLNRMPWRRGRVFSVEKTLEAWIMENIHINQSLKENLLDLQAGEVEWFGNYLPFGVSGSNIDAVIIQGRDGSRIKTATVVELKRDPLNQEQFNKAAIQTTEYCEFIGKAMGAFGVEASLRGVVISGANNQGQVYRRDEGNISWTTYEIGDDGCVIFQTIPPQ